MLAYTLAAIVAIGSLIFYIAAFFFPEVHRKSDFLWSGVGFFYSLVLLICAKRITGGVLLGQTASVSLILWFGWQTLSLRQQKAPETAKTEVPPEVTAKINHITSGKWWENFRDRLLPKPKPTIKTKAPAPAKSPEPQVLEANLVTEETDNNLWDQTATSEDDTVLEKVNLVKRTTDTSTVEPNLPPESEVSTSETPKPVEVDQTPPTVEVGAVNWDDDWDTVDATTAHWEISGAEEITPVANQSETPTNAEVAAVNLETSAPQELQDQPQEEKGTSVTQLFSTIEPVTEEGLAIESINLEEIEGITENLPSPEPEVPNQKKESSKSSKQRKNNRTNKG